MGIGDGSILVERVSIVENILQDVMDKLATLEKKVETLDMEKKLKIDYMLKMNQLEKNDKTHQALYDKLFEEIAEFRSYIDLQTEEIHTRSHNFANRIQEQINELKEILQGFMEIVDITITDNVDGQSLEYFRERKAKLLEKLDVGSARQTEGLIPVEFGYKTFKRTEKKERPPLGVLADMITIKDSRGEKESLEGCKEEVDRLLLVIHGLEVDLREVSLFKRGRRGGGDVHILDEKLPEHQCKDCRRREIRCESDIEFRRMCLKTNRNCFEPKTEPEKEEE